MDEYRITWCFIGDWFIKDRVCEENMAFDYLHSLYLWLKPGLVLQNAHKLLCVQSIAAIFEAVMINHACQFVSPTKKNILKKEILRYRASKIIDILKKEEVLDTEWSAFMKKLFELRNYVHLAKIDGYYEKVAKYNPTELTTTLSKFRDYMFERCDDKHPVPF